MRPDGGESTVVPPPRSALLERLTRLDPPDAPRLATSLVVHASLCLAKPRVPAAPPVRRRSGSWRPYLQPSALPSGWDVTPWLCDVDHLDPGECAEAAVLGVPAQPVPMAWVGPGQTFRLVDGGAVVGQGVVLAVHWPA